MSKKISYKRIGSLYLHNSSFVSEANQTIGEVGLNEEVLSNRQKVSHKLTDQGKQQLRILKTILSTKLKREVKFSWSKKCGCASCPCSPGFIISIDNSDKVLSSDDRLNADYGLNLYVDKDCRISNVCIRPEYKDVFHYKLPFYYASLEGKRLF